MSVKLNSDFAEGQKAWIKRSMKGRPVHFGLQAQGPKKGKLIVSKNPGDVKSTQVKKLQPYEGQGKDAKKAKERNDVSGTPAQGVCQGEKGTLTLYFERGSAPAAAESFVQHFITREIKLKQVKRVRIAEVDKLPDVPDKHDTDGQQPTTQSVQERVKELAERVAKLGKETAGIPKRLQQAKDLATTKPLQAEDDLDSIEGGIDALERALALEAEIADLHGKKGVGEAQEEEAGKQIKAARDQVSANDLDQAEECLSAAEEAVATMRNSAAWQARQTSLQERVKAVLKDDPEALSGGDKKTVTNLFKKSAELAAKGDHAKAAVTHDGVESILTQARLGQIESRLTGARDGLNLSKSEKSELNLADNAKAVAKSLNKLRGQLPSAIYDKLESEFAAITQRVKQAADDGDKAAATLEAEQLKVLMRQAEFLLDSSDKNQRKLDEAIRAHADALIGDIRARENPKSDDELANALVEHMQKLVADKNTTDDQTAAALRAIHLLGKRRWGNDGKEIAPNDGVDPTVKKAAQDAAARLIALHEEQMKTKGPSEAPRDAPRTPSEVLIHFQSALGKALKQDGKNETLKKLMGGTRKAYLQHAITVEQTRKLLEEAGAVCRQKKLDDLAGLCDTLLASMPKKSEDVPSTRLHDNIYGRVFDSKFIGDLVENPPEDVKKSMQEAGKAMADLLDSVGGSSVWAGNKIKEYLNTKDPRFWIPKAPGLEKVRDAQTKEEAFAELKKFLRGDMTNGQECVAMPYVLCKLSLFLTSIGGGPWMTDANENYNNVIMKQTGREKSMVPEDVKLKTEGAGITLRHQPTAVKEDWMVPSQRPTTINRPQIGGEDMSGTDTSTGQRTTEAIQEALSHGAPYASGVSGSTNIMLHLLKHLKDHGKNIDTKSYLLGTMMFLVYDGGHSMHEVLWTANQLNKKLDLKLDLGGDSDKPGEFIADYEKFAALYGGKSGEALQRATNSAWNETAKYFDEHSYYAGDGTPQPTTTGSGSGSTTPTRDTTVKSGNDETGGNQDNARPDPAPTVFDTGLPANPTLYAIHNRDGEVNFRVSGGNPGGQWFRVEQFCAYLAVQWLNGGCPGSGLKFSGLSNKDSAVQTVSGWAAEGGAGQQVNWARGQIGGQTVSKGELKTKLKNGTFGTGTRIWFGNDDHVCAAVVKDGGQVLVYDPNAGSTREMATDAFGAVPPNNPNVFVVA